VRRVIIDEVLMQSCSSNIAGEPGSEASIDEFESPQMMPHRPLQPQHRQLPAPDLFDDDQNIDDASVRGSVT
jgi:hypothetical protein